ncbi:recombinase family protein [Tistlia sp.]|uniref:recombinase family protein n=1 Tax=Tistlia sp. TaxID=3057121 RepID=UPI0034A4536A
MRAALYLRVSTVRQAEKDLSIPDQRSQVAGHCQARGWEVVGEYVEAGASGTDENRPQLQQLIADAQGGGEPFDVVVVHSFSRFFRDAYQFEFHRRKLAKHGIQLVSITQETGDDPMGNMVRQILNLFDEYQSKENAKHVLRAMKENARQGFWNGGPTPYGYRSVAVETRGDSVKKRLEVEPSEAELVRLIYGMFRTGQSGTPMGIRAIAGSLNSKGYTYRRGRAWTSGLVHAILRNGAYRARHYFNTRCVKTRTRKDSSEWIEVATPRIVEDEAFEAVQALLEQRRPAVTPPRIVNGPTLLTGIARCASCGAGMTIRTGKGGRYRYYACNRRMTEGACRCKGRSIRMETLDEAVLSKLEDRIFQPERVQALLGALSERLVRSADDHKTQARKLRSQLRDVDDKLARLYDAVAEGTVERTDAFKNSVSRHERHREELMRLIAAADRRRALPVSEITVKDCQRFADAVRSKLREPDGALRKAYVRQFVERVELDDEEIRISGPKAALAGALLHSGAPDRQVPSSVREWWAHKDSNLGPAD